MQLISLVRWLKDVVEGLGGTTPVVHLELVRQLDIKRVHISFQVPVRHVDFSSMEPGGSILLDDTHGFNCRSGWRGTHLDNL